MDEQKLKSLSGPQDTAVAKSRQRVQDWFIRTAPRVQWDAIESPLGLIYLAASVEGLCSVDFGVQEDTFLARLDALAHLEHSRSALAPAEEQIREYFAGQRRWFDLAVDLRRLTPFQRNVLQVTRTIQAGTVWTYGQVAAALGNPKASRPVGTALAHNPVPIVIPCHRVVASNGKLGGYSAGAGLESKRLLLKIEGAL